MASESDSPQAIGRTPAEPSTPSEGTRQERCTLTDAERVAVEDALEANESESKVFGCEVATKFAATLRGLLERTR
jgi:hypothetical protein